MRSHGKLSLWLLLMLSALLALPVASQRPGPVLDVFSLMDQRFYPQRGGFLLGDLRIAFLPEGATVEAVFLREGREVERVPLAAEALSIQSVFASLGPHMRPGNVDLVEPGDYELRVDVDGTPAGSLRFSMRRDASDDPFAPNASYRLEGPWPELAALSWDARADEPLLYAHVWVSQHELREGERYGRLVLRRGAREVASSPRFSVSSPVWFERRDVLRSDPRRSMKRGELVDGSYTLALVVEEREVRRYAFRVRRGEITGSARGRLEHQPRHTMLLPRTVIGMGSDAREANVAWLERD